MPRFLTVGLLALLAGCKSITGASDITYEVTGAGRASVITYVVDGGTLQQGDASLPWSFAFQADKGDPLYVSAQKDGTASTCIFVRILRRGEIVESGTSCGAFVIASASGTN